MDAVLKKPELLLPAGDMEKLKTAIRFGADAVYLGGHDFSLRAAAGNFTPEEMQAGLEYAHGRGIKLYAAVNIFAHNRDLEALPAYLEALAAMGMDGIIVSDPGVIRLARRFAPDMPITLSTQANVCNYEGAAFYQDMGVSRIVLARELNLEELAQMRQRLSLELEVFVHGAMCMAYSGRCMLSAYMTGRSANRGECAHPCRYRYALREEQRPGQYFPIEEDRRGSYILNSRDLCLLEYLPQLMELGIDSFKIEGRMKSPLYVATTAMIYRQAIDHILRGCSCDPLATAWQLAELAAVSPRPFTAGFIAGENRGMQDSVKADDWPRNEFCAMAVGWDDKKGVLELEQRSNFGPREKNLEMLMPDIGAVPFPIAELWDIDGNTMDRARHPRQRVFCSCAGAIPAGSILLRRGSG
ncbi:MAG: U32 family peptidase [Syntrophomonadaceae bacterium]|nr:U32 family peptidase [Syntrophomonadaceae bacterium]